MSKILFKNTHLMQRLNFKYIQNLNNFTKNFLKTDLFPIKYFCEVIFLNFSLKISTKFFIIFCKVRHNCTININFIYFIKVYYHRTKHSIRRQGGKARFAAALISTHT